MANKSNQQMLGMLKEVYFRLKYFGYLTSYVFMSEVRGFCGKKLRTNM